MAWFSWLKPKRVAELEARIEALERSNKALVDFARAHNGCTIKISDTLVNMAQTQAWHQDRLDDIAKALKLKLPPKPVLPVKGTHLSLVKPPTDVPKTPV